MRSSSSLRTFLALLALSMQVSTYSCQEPLVWCARDQEDVTLSGKWIRQPPSVWNYAPTVEDLPDVFRTKMSGDGIFWAEGADNLYSLFYIQTQVALNSPKIYLYVKYYVHLASRVNEGFGALPGNNYTGLPISNIYDFQWREALVEVDPSIIALGQSYLGVASANLSPDQYVLIDEIVIVQGREIQSPEQASALCAPKRPITFECIDNDRDFATENWLNLYDPYSYAASASSLPDAIKRNVSGTGIYYVEGSEAGSKFALGKDYSTNGRLPSGQAFVYFRYMTILAEETKAWIFATGIDVYQDSNLKPLPYSTRFDWTEALLPLRRTGNWVGIEVQGLQPGEFFLVDKIAVVAGGSLDNVLTDIAVCRNKK